MLITSGTHVLNLLSLKTYQDFVSKGRLLSCNSRDRFSRLLKLMYEVNGILDCRSQYCSNFEFNLIYLTLSHSEKFPQKAMLLLQITETLKMWRIKLH